MITKRASQPVMADSHPPPTAGPAPASLAVSCVRALMERHGLPKYRQSAWLADAIGLSYAQAHRRMNGTSPWSLEDLAQVAGLFGESLADLVGLGLPQSSVPAVMNRRQRSRRVSVVARRSSRQAGPRVGRRRQNLRGLGRGAGDGSDRWRRLQDRANRGEADRGSKKGHRGAGRRPGPDQLDLRSLPGERLRRETVLQDCRSALGHRFATVRRATSSTGSSARKARSS